MILKQIFSGQSHLRTYIPFKVLRSTLVQKEMRARLRPILAKHAATYQFVRQFLGEVRRKETRVDSQLPSFVQIAGKEGVVAISTSRSSSNGDAMKEWLPLAPALTVVHTASHQHGSLRRRIPKRWWWHHNRVHVVSSKFVAFDDKKQWSELEY